MSVLTMIPVGELETLTGAQKTGPAQEKKALGVFTEQLPDTGFLLIGTATPLV